MILLRKIYTVILGIALILFAIYLLEFDTVESLDRLYSGSGIPKQLLKVLYSLIGQAATVAFLVALAVYVIVSQFGILSGRGRNDRSKT